MIPLLKPEIPRPERWYAHWQHSITAAQYSNFGPCFDMATSAVNRHTGGHTLLVTNGTVAITVALLTQFKPGDRIAVPEFTVPATINAVIGAGMIPVIFPCKRDTWALDYSVVSSVDGAIVVCPFGLKLDTTFYEAWAQRRGIDIIYDFAGAWGQFPATKFPVTYSFHATKNFSIGEGGCIVFSDPESFETARKLTNFGYEKDRTVSTAYGMNAKMEEMRCAMVLAMLDNPIELTERIERKIKLYKIYNLAFAQEPWFEPNFRFMAGAPSMCVFRFPGRSAVLEERLLENGIIAKRYYYPMLSLSRCFKKFAVVAETDPYFNDCIALPSSVNEEEVQDVIQAIKKVLS